MRVDTIVSILQILIVLTLLNSCAAPSVAPIDLTITDIFITQGIQTHDNAIQLVAQRSTAIRVLIGTGSNTSVPNVTGRLRIYVDGEEVPQYSALKPINKTPFTATAKPKRDNQEDTLNFELLAPTGFDAFSVVEFQVDIATTLMETNTNNNSRTISRTFISRTMPTVIYTPINYLPDKHGLPNPTQIKPGVGDAFVRAVYPIDDGQQNFYRKGLFPPLLFDVDNNGDGFLSGVDHDSDVLLLRLATYRHLMVNCGLGANNTTFLYGWVVGNPMKDPVWGRYHGEAKKEALVAFGNTEENRYQRTFAHELGHLFDGLLHPDYHDPLTAEEFGWDVGARLFDNPLINNVEPGRVKPKNHWDFMVTPGITNKTWVHPKTYKVLLENPILSGTGPTAQSSPSVAVIQGILDLSGDKLVLLKPMFRFPWKSELPLNPPQEGRYIVIFLDEMDEEIASAPFNGFVPAETDESDEIVETVEGVKVRYGFFEVMVPLENLERKIGSVEIIDTQEGNVLGSLKHASPPTVKITSPSIGGQLGTETKVAWEANDLDPDVSPEKLMYLLAYSHNNGQSWVPLAVDIPGEVNAVYFDSTEILESEGTGVIRLFVSDGLNTVFTDVTGLTTLEAKYPKDSVPACDSTGRTVNQ